KRRKKRVSDANPTRGISRPWLALGSRRHQGVGLPDGGPPARPGLAQRAGVRPRFMSSSNGLGIFFGRLLTKCPAGPPNTAGIGRRIMQTKRYWLDYDPVALAVLVIGIGAIELLALSF